MVAHTRLQIIHRWNFTHHRVSVVKSSASQVGRCEVIKGLQAEFARMDKSMEVYKQFVQQQMVEEVKLKAKLDGFPKEWTTKEQVLRADGLQALVGKAVDADVWVRKDGSGVGVAMLSFGSVADRRAAVQKAKELKLKFEGRNVYMNHAKTDLEQKRDKPLISVFGELKKQWQGDKGGLRMTIGEEERCIRAAGRVVAVQDKGTWEVVWRVRREEVRNEKSVHAARAVE